MRTNYNYTATLQRLGAYGDTATYGAVSGSVLGWFIPLEGSQKTIALGIIGQGYEFTCDGAEDVRVNDIMTIDTVAYSVKGVSRFKSFSQDILKVVLELNVKD